MVKKQSSIDGFVLKRSSHQLGSLANMAAPKQPVKVALSNAPKAQAKPVIASTLNIKGDEINLLGTEQESRDLSRSDINESLIGINSNQDPEPKLSRRQRRRLKKQAKIAKKKARTRFRKILGIILRLLIVAALAFAGYTGYKVLSASNSVFKGNIFQVFQNEPLKQDANGRSNFLILGTSEDDPGHEGANLTDSMMVVSIDQANKNAYTFSIPRDLYVDYGKACISGYSGKINVYFYCANDGETAADEQDRLTKTQALIGDIFGLQIQYGIHVNYTVLKQAVDAVGGVDVDIQGSNGADGVMDRHFDYQCGYTCYLVKYDNGVHHLDGQQALNLARVRGDEAPTYGLSRSNFDREINQQKILIALKEKAVSSGTLSDFNKVTKLIDALGSNLRTNIQTNEIRTLIDIATNTKSTDIHMISLVGDNGAKAVMTTSDNNVIPMAGIYNYTDIQEFIKKSMSSDPIVQESAPIVVLNGSGTDGLGKQKADELTAAGYNISTIDTAPEGTYEAVEVYQIGTDSSATAAALAKRYGVTIKTTTPPVYIADDVEFVIIFGA